MIRPSLDNLFDTASPYYNGALRLSLPPSGKNAFSEALSPDSAGTGEQGTQLLNLSRDLTALTILPADDLQKALDKLEILGGGRILLTAGTYNIASTITVPRNVTIEGNGALIDFGGGAYQMSVVGSSAYSTGTLSVSNDGTAITGSGTTWVASMIGQFILLEDFWYEITAVGSATGLTIATPYVGTTLAGSAYVIATTIDTIILRDFTLQNSSIALLKVQYVDSITLKNLILTDGLVGLDGDDSSAVTIDGVLVDTCGTGMTFDNFYYGTFFNSNITNSTSGGGVICNLVRNWGFEIFATQNIVGNSISFQNSSNIGIANFSIRETVGKGMEFVSGNFAITMENGTVVNSSSDGIKLTATTDTCQFLSMNIQGNGGYGVNIAASTCDNNIIVANNFASNSSGALNDSGTGTLVRSNIGLADSGGTTVSSKFGGTGADGALAVSSGTTSIDLGSSKYVVKNYSSVSITGTGAINFTNPHATGSFVILKSQGAVTLTSSATPMIDGTGVGAPGGAAVSGTADQVGVVGTNGLVGTLTTNAGAASATVTTAAVGGAVPTSYTVNQLLASTVDSAFLKYWNHMFVGAGASSGCIQTNVGGTHTSGAGGRGGGALIIECAGAWNFTTAGGISVAGIAGGAATCATREAGGGGGGAGGSFLALYNTLTANSGTVTVTGGSGGAGCGTFFANTSGGAGGGSDQVGSNGITANPHTGGAGANGRSLILSNTAFT